MSLDLFAPIIPGVSVGGFKLREKIANYSIKGYKEEIIKRTPPLDNYPKHLIGSAYSLEEYEEKIAYLKNEFSDLHIYRTKGIEIHVKNEIIQNMGIYSPYKGKFLETFGIGSTIHDIQKIIDVCCVEDIHDELAFFNIDGMCFYTEDALDFCKSPIKSIFVFLPSEFNYFSHIQNYYPLCPDTTSKKWLDLLD